MLALGTFAKSANEGDFRLLTAELGKARTDADKRELVKQFKKLIRNREAVATTVSSVAAVKKPAAKARPSASVTTPTGAPVAVSLADGGGDDDDEFELESLF